jgi:hypothetical protein
VLETFKSLKKIERPLKFRGGEPEVGWKFSRYLGVQVPLQKTTHYDCATYAVEVVVGVVQHLRALDFFQAFKGFEHSSETLVCRGEVLGLLRIKH